MNRKDAKEEILKLISRVEKLTPKKIDEDLKPLADFPNIPDWHKYEQDIWKIGEDIRQILSNFRLLYKDKELLEKIAAICLCRNSKRGRQSFILLLGNVDSNIYADKLITQLDDEFVCGHVIDTIYKMNVSKYVEKIKPYCKHKESWIRNKAKQYVEKYGS